MPQLTPVVDKIEEVPEAARTFYVQREGKFHLDLSGTPSGFVPAAELAAANGKVVEFRDTNIALTKQNAELLPLKDKYKDIDADEAREALAEKKKLKDKGIKNVDEIQTVISAALKPVQDQLTALTAASAEKDRTIQQQALRTTIQDVFVKAGGMPDVLDYIVEQAKPVFVVEGGTVKAVPTQFSADRPGEPLSVTEWIARQVKEKPWAFKASNGGGAANGGKGAGGGGRQQMPGVVVIKDPTPAQLGEFGPMVKQGKARFEFSDDAQ